jgi:hypothetical protein
MVQSRKSLLSGRIGIMKIEDLHSAIELALAYDVEDEGNTDQIVETIFDGIVKALQRGTRFPRLARADYDLLFADLMKEARETLLPYWRIDTEDAAEIIADAVANAISEARYEARYEARRRRKNPEAAAKGAEHSA